MREDYDYVDGATAVCLDTTEAGHEYLGEKETFGDYDELLLLVETEYVCVIGGIEAWVRQINEKYRENYGVEWKCSKELVLKALEQGHLGIRKVIWD